MGSVDELQKGKLSANIHCSYGGVDRKVADHCRLGVVCLCSFTAYYTVVAGNSHTYSAVNRFKIATNQDLLPVEWPVGSVLLGYFSLFECFNGWTP